MAVRMAAVIGAAGLLVAAQGAVGSAEPGGAVAVPGAGPCLTDPKPVHEDLIPETLEVPVPYPVVTVLPPEPPEPEPVRTEMTLPSDPCVNPCPDLTDLPEPPPSLANRLGIPEILVNPKPFYFALPGPSPDPGEVPPPPAPVTPPTEAAPREAAPAAPRVVQVREVAKQTGANSVNRTDKRWQVDGTDLGIMWESGPGEVAVAFGDTVGRGFHPPGGMGGDWRSNVLAFSTDRDLSDGMTYDRMVTDSRCHAAEVLSSRKLDNVEITTIPTSGFALGDRQYLSYMSIRTWNSGPGTFYTNYGGIAYSDDRGQTWTKDPHARWDNIFGLANFQVSAMVPHGDHVYVFGTPNTRLGAVGLARVPADQLLNKTAYQYWRDGQWTPVGGAASATPVVDAPAGELSVRFDASRGVWQMSYLDTARAAIVVREATTPQGAWSAPTPTVLVLDYPELYGGFIHPWSSGRDLYFNITTWSDYNVYLMHAELAE
ncbi:DUF4185 domain-containing protein [Nocardia farcinica]|uniref:DUF4185 domain-containing protein n=1 Tax=Nocardia farcinica TaxID=37329 RepID=UPI0018953F15|nr:DUF4185 domain-containing protein [Nocardia farcinica]MBF6264737.1 DUF4185 domain-containing protein [Nocardia farcinica]MBF6283523.1 DUF4185 domain-containing protein [Nocardia farcinica]MBF6307305.1 DUF4185 domain-containing protein [Nocardia farcinica]MBF6392141.1 DUF4185 domain-containing protein [Nocardia farcinica]MBF6492349.1 DUF4185 domain-containing protein [Nocardia farcinica]